MLLGKIDLLESKIGKLSIIFFNWPNVLAFNTETSRVLQFHFFTGFPAMKLFKISDIQENNLYSRISLKKRTVTVWGKESTCDRIRVWRFCCWFTEESWDMSPFTRWLPSWVMTNRHEYTSISLNFLWNIHYNSKLYIAKWFYSALKPPARLDIF